MPSPHLTSSTRLTRSGPRRLGDEYQDVQALERIVRWLEHNEEFDWLKIEADDGGFLDDVQMMHSDRVLELWQIKYSTNALTSSDVWTWDTLLKRESGARGPKPSLLERWFESWKKTKQESGSTITMRPVLISNRDVAPEISCILSLAGVVSWQNIDGSIRSNIIEQLGDSTEARAFLAVFQFRVRQPGLQELEGAVYERFERMGGTPTGWGSLQSAVRDWAKTQDYPNPEGKIYLDDIRRVCGLKVRPVRLRTFLPPSVYFEEYLDPDHLFFHGYPLVGRRTQLRQIESFLQSDKRIGILAARGGNGKTKLLQGLCARLAKRGGEEAVRLLGENLPITAESLDELPDERCLVIVDDAHNRSGLEILLQAARQHKGLRVLLASRPHAVDYLSTQIRSAGFDSRQTEQFSTLPDLSFPRDLQRLAKVVLGWEWAHYSSELASVTRDSPLLTVLGGRLLREKQVHPSLLSQEDEFRREVLERFRDIRMGEIATLLGPQVSPEFCAALLPWIAVVSPLNCGHEDLIQVLAQQLGVDVPRLLQVLDQLVKGGALVRGGKLVRIVPDVLSDYILHEACLTSDGSPTGWATQAFESLKEVALNSVLRNLAELDWRVRSGMGREVARTDNESTLLNQVWRDIEQQFRQGPLKERLAWLRRFERFSYMQPTRLWPIIKVAVHEPITVAEAEEESQPSILEQRLFTHKPTQETVLAAVPAVIRGIAYDERYTARCAHLLWHLARDQETKPNHTTTALSTLRQLASYEHGKPFTFNHIILECCREWMRDPQRESYRQSVLTVLEPLLQRRIDDLHGDGRWVQHISYTLSPEPILELRRDVLRLVETFALSPRRELVFQSLKTLSSFINDHNLHRSSGRDKWDAEQLMAVGIVEKVARSNSDPFVRLKVWETLHHQAARGARVAVKKRCREVLALVPHEFWGRLILVLCGQIGYGPYIATWPVAGMDSFEEDEEPEDGENYSKRWQRNQARGEAIAREVVAEFVAKFSEAVVAFDELNNWMEKVQESHWTDKPSLSLRSNHFLVHLALDFPDMASAFCEVALTQSRSFLATRCFDLLETMRRQGTEPAVALAQLFLDSGHDTLALVVAQSYSWNGWPLTPTPQEWQMFERLLSHENPIVRGEAASILRIIAKQNESRAIDLLLSFQIGDHEGLTEQLFENFTPHGGIPFSALTVEQRNVLLDKLRPPASIGDYHTGQFLSDALVVDPLAVTRLLVERLKHKTQLELARWNSQDEERESLRQQAKEFKALPEHGWRDDENKKWKSLPAHPDYRDALRLVRDTVVHNAPLQYEDTIAELFRDLSLYYGEISLEVLNEWIDSGDSEKLYEMTGLLDCTATGFYFSRPQWLEHALQSARKCGFETFEKVEAALMHHALYGPKRAVAYHRGERSSQLFNGGKKALDAVANHSFAAAFYTKIMRYGQKMIEDEMREEAEEEVFFRG